VKIYTKTGDQGQTGLFGGARVPKSHPRVDAYGDVDELNCAIGAARAHAAARDMRTDTLLHEIQSELFVLGAELAKDPRKDVDLGIAVIEERDVVRLEAAIDELERDLLPLKSFVLPGGSIEAAMLHLARAACRRAERKLVAFAQTETLRPELLRYLNRLSDLLFVMARHANFRAKVPDVPWLGRKAP
jgi:cob(I)alamin adenosyltransferase